MHAKTLQRTTFDKTLPRAFVAVLASIFATSAALTIAWCSSMGATDGMPMPGGWTLSMMWMPMDGQTWLGAAASFLGMWLVMMVAMMLPSFAPTLWRLHQSASRAGAMHPSAMAAMMAAGYFVIWTMLGIVVFPIGAALASIEMARPAVAQAVPWIIGIVVLAAGALQFTAWKAHGLARCRRAPERVSTDLGTAWREGVRHGVHCVHDCAGLTLILLAWGVMDLHAMALVTTAITAERLASAATPIVRAIGITAVVAGVLLIARAAGLA